MRLDVKAGWAFGHLLGNKKSLSLIPLDENRIEKSSNTRLRNYTSEKNIDYVENVDTTKNCFSNVKLYLNKKGNWIFDKILLNRMKSNLLEM